MSARSILLLTGLLWGSLAVLAPRASHAQNDWGVEWKGGGDTGAAEAEPAPEAEPAAESEAGLAPGGAPEERAEPEYSETRDASTGAEAGWGPMTAATAEETAEEAEAEGETAPTEPQAMPDLTLPHRLMIVGAALVGASILVGAAVGIITDEVETASLLLAGGLGSGVITLGIGAMLRRRRLLDSGHEDDERAARPLPRGPELRLTLRY